MQFLYNRRDFKFLNIPSKFLKKVPRKLISYGLEALTVLLEDVSSYSISSNKNLLLVNLHNKNLRITN